MKYYTDGKRHLVCIPYSVENLHLMAEDLDIKRGFYHTKPYAHYDIPVRRKEEIEAQCLIVRPREIIFIAKGTYGTKWSE